MVDTKVAPKMVREADLLAVKSKHDKLVSENQTLKSRVARLEKRLEIVDLTDVEDGDLKNVKQLFLDREVELDEREKKLNEKADEINDLESAHKERERADLVKSLAEKYKIDAEALKDTEDPEKKALQLYVERLASGDKKEEESSPEDVFEHMQAGGKFKKSPLEMDDKELVEFEKAHAKA